MALVDTDNLLKRFSRYLRLERGLSENTIAGYIGYRCTVAGSYYFGDKIFFQFFENGEMHRYESFGIDRDS